VDGRRGVAVELLVDDVSGQRLERVVQPAYLQREGAGALHQPGQRPVGRAEVTHGLFGVVTEPVTPYDPARRPSRRHLHRPP
jgi:hypothetical protein